MRRSWLIVIFALGLGIHGNPSPPPSVADEQAVDVSSSTDAPDVVEAADEAAALASEADGGAGMTESPPAPPPAEASQPEAEATFDEEAEPDSTPEEEAVDASAPEELPEVRSGSSVQWVVTKKMQARLSELGYTGVEIEQLDPERAAAIIRRSITRPASGVPSGWNRGVRRQQHPLRAAVHAGQGLLTAIRKPFATPPTVVPLILTGLLGALGCLKVANGASGSAQVKQALAPDPSAITEIAPSKGSSSDELWLDVQIDRFIAFLKVLIGK